MIDLYTWTTPNGRKISIMLEELGVPYTAHAVNIDKGEHRTPEFEKISPNIRIPAIVDREADDFAVFESGAVMMYLAEKTGRFIGETAADKARVVQWLMFQMGGVGPMFGQLGFFYKFAGKDIDDPRPAQRYIDEAKRLLAVVEGQLDGKDWIAGDFSIADIALAPWLGALDFYGAQEVTGFHDLTNVPAYLERFNARPAVARGRKIPDPKG